MSLTFMRCDTDVSEPLTEEAFGKMVMSPTEISGVFKLLRGHDDVVHFDSGIDAILGTLRASDQLLRILSNSDSGARVLKWIWGFVWFTVALFISFYIFGLDFGALLAPVLVSVLIFIKSKFHYVVLDVCFGIHLHFWYKHPKTLACIY